MLSSAVKSSSRRHSDRITEYPRGYTGTSVFPQATAMQWAQSLVPAIIVMHITFRCIITLRIVDIINYRVILFVQNSNTTL